MVMSPYLRGWMRTGAVNLETVTCRSAKNVLSENASRRITVAKNEDFVRRVGVHFELHRAKAIVYRLADSHLSAQFDQQHCHLATGSKATSIDLVFPAGSFGRWTLSNPFL